MKHRRALAAALVTALLAAAMIGFALRSGGGGEHGGLARGSAERAEHAERSGVAPSEHERSAPRLDRRAELPLLARCIDAATREPVSGVVFALHAERPPTGLDALRATSNALAPQRLASDAHGELRAERRAGTRFLELDDPRWVGGELHEIADAASAEAPTLELVRAGAVRGRVLAPAGHELTGFCRVFALPGVALYLEQPALLARLRSAICDADGAFEIGGLAPAEGWQLLACATGFESTRSAQTFAVRAGERWSCDVELPEPRTISGRVVDSGGAPIAGVRVVLELDIQYSANIVEEELAGSWTWGVETLHEASSDAQGGFCFLGLPPAGFRVWASAANGTTSMPFAAEAAEKESESFTGIELELERGRSLRGRVLDAEGHPVPDAEIVLAQVAQRARIDAQVWSATSAADGGFAFDGLPAPSPRTDSAEDLLEGQIRAAGFAPRTVADRFPSSGELEVRLPARGPFALRVQCRRTRAPIARYSVVLEVEERGEQQVIPIEVRDPQGLFLPPRTRCGKVFRVEASGFRAIEQPWPTLASGEQLIELEPLGAIRGRVIDEDRRPIEGARVLIEGTQRAVVSDAVGRFELDASRKSWMTVRAEKEGFLSSNLGVDSEDGDEILLALERGGNLHGFVRTADGVPATDRAVLLSRIEPALLRLARTDERGRYRFERLASGTYELGLVSSDTPLEALELRGHLENLAVIVSPQETVVDLVDAPRAPASLRGRVVNLEGAPVPHAKVELWIELSLGRLQTARPELATETDAEGRFDFPALPAGDAWINYGIADEEQEAYATLDEGQSVELLLALGRGAITGRVLAEESDLPLAGLELDCLPEGEMAVVVAANTVETDQEGRFTFEGLPLGNYTVRARTERAERFGARKVELRPGAAQQQLELRLARGAALEVEVRGIDGRPIEAQEVWVHTADGACESLHGGPLRFAEHVPAGRCEISTTGDGGAFAIQELELRAGETRHLQLQLSRGATLAFDVRDEGGSPCGLAELALERVSAPGHSPAFAFQLARCDFEVDGRGNSNVKRVPAGRYRARAQRGSQMSELVEFELEDGQKRRVALVVR